MKCAYMLLAGLVLAGGCRPATIEQMAQTTVLIDTQTAERYENVADDCRAASDNWDEYDVCMSHMERVRASVLSLYQATRVLDISTRRSFKASACRWLQAVENVHTLLPVPATLPALSSKWSRKCS